MRENKLLANAMWGVSAIVGFLIAEKIYDIGMKFARREDSQEELEIDILEEESL